MNVALLTLFLTVLAVLFPFALTQDNDTCPQGDAIHIGDSHDAIATYNMAGAALQLFGSLEVPCSGWLSAWEIGLKSSVVNFTGLHLAVFRKVKCQKNCQGIFSLVGKSRLGLVQDNGINGILSDTFQGGPVPPDNLIPVTALDKGWYRFSLPTLAKFEVRRGDTIGLFYDSFRASAPVVPHKTDPANPSVASAKPTYTLPVDASSLKTANAIDMSEAATATRFPALNALVDADRSSTSPVTSTTTEPPSTTTTSQKTTRTTKIKKISTTSTTTTETAPGSTPEDTTPTNPATTTRPKTIKTTKTTKTTRKISTTSAATTEPANGPGEDDTTAAPAATTKKTTRKPTTTQKPTSKLTTTKPKKTTSTTKSTNTQQTTTSEEWE